MMGAMLKEMDPEAERRALFYMGSLLRSRSARDRWISICWIDSLSRIFRRVSASTNHPKPSSSKKTISFFFIHGQRSFDW